MQVDCLCNFQAGLRCDWRSESRGDLQCDLEREWCFDLRCDSLRDADGDSRFDLRKDSSRDPDSGSQSDMDDELGELPDRARPRFGLVARGRGRARAPGRGDDARSGSSFLKPGPGNRELAVLVVNRIERVEQRAGAGVLECRCLL